MKPQNDGENVVDELAPFAYDLPQEKIAQSPIEPRSSAKLLDATGGQISDRHVIDIADLLKEGDLLVVNNTKVLPARVKLYKASGGGVELLFLEEEEAGIWKTLARPSKGLAKGTELMSSNGELAVRVIDRIESHLDAPVRVIVEVIDPSVIESQGSVPLPPYIKATLSDPSRYQTVYANRPSSAAAPTAGLHFDELVLSALSKRGIEIAQVELSVGLDTFLPIKTNKIEDHQIHTEHYEVGRETWERISAAKRVVAVGTTVVRTLETVAKTGQLEGRSSLFIHRPYEYKVVDLLMTNFHIPRSSLLLLVDAFLSEGRWREIYEHGLANDYRFLSFGDAMLLERGM
ncbi:MAG: tRNA preQ1(34) S-adenosylmethionine ribosyltransferase-isomerase QueA [Actinomycetota bacterium]|nr:tRNA preQ1(34) S-adenosylmethionine ribosyltransferase-isomerase QueA [Actinomycetota bacterium]